MVRLHRRVPTMKLFVKTLSKQAECKKKILSVFCPLYLNQRFRRGQKHVISSHLRVALRVYRCLSVPSIPHSYLCERVCMCFTYHLTDSWYPREKKKQQENGIITEMAGRGKE